MHYASGTEEDAWLQILLASRLEDSLEFHVIRILISRAEPYAELEDLTFEVVHAVAPLASKNQQLYALS